MKLKQYLILIIVIILGTSLIAKNLKGQITPKKLAFNKTSHDFGEAEQNKRITTIFYFTNKTTKKIEIKKVHRSCGCTVPKLKKRILEPNEVGEVSVTFNTGRYKGKIGKSITIETIPAINPRPKVGIKVNVLPPELVFEPRKLFIAKFTNSSPIYKKFKIYSKRNKDFKISSIKYNTNYFIISSEQYDDDKSQTHGYNILVKIKTKDIKANERIHRANRFSENITFSFKEAKQASLNFSIYGRLR
jgi:hypothetical protein